MKSHAATWVISLLAALLIYVATWPLVEIHFALTTLHPPPSYVPVLLYTSSGTSPGGVWTTSQIGYIPRWVAAFYRPLRLLREANGEDNPIEHYWNWWAGILK